MPAILKPRGACLHLASALALLVCVAAAGCAGEEVSRAVRAAVTLDLPDSLPSGSPLDIGYTWTPAADFDPPADDFRIFVHLVDPDGRIVVQDDHFPPVPTSQWRAGEPVSYRHWVYPDQELEVAYLDFYVGLYDETTREQVATLADGGLENRPLVHSVIIRTEDRGGVPVFMGGFEDPETSLTIEDPASRTWRWIGKQATAAFGHPRGPSTLHLRALSPIDYLDGSQTVIIRAGEREIVRFEVTETGPYVKRIEIPGDAFDEGDWVELTFEVDKTFVPAQIEPGSDDIRELGMQVFWMYLAR